MEREQSMNDKDEDATAAEEEDSELEEALLLVKEMEWQKVAAVNKNVFLSY